MRHRLHYALIWAILLGITSSSRAQNNASATQAAAPLTARDPAAEKQAAKIINQCVKAAGGARAFSHIQTLSLEGTVTRPVDPPSAPATSDAIGPPASPNSGTFTLDTKLPNRYYSELVFGSQRFIAAYNGKSAWRQDVAINSGNPITLTSPASVELETEAQLANSHFLNLKNNKFAATFLGHAQVRGKDALHIELTSAAGAKREFFFDAESHLLLEESANAGDAIENVFLSDYRVENGVQIAHKLELQRLPVAPGAKTQDMHSPNSNAADSYAIEITRVSINEPIGERVFDLPLGSQVKLPDLKALFKEIDANQKVIDKIKEDYAGKRLEEETEYNGDNSVKKRSVTESTFFYFDGEEISTTTAKDGKALSDAEEKKEQEKAQKRVEEIQKRQEKKDAKDEKAKEEGKQEKDDDDVGIETFLRACQFVNPRRERFRGQDVLVFDFEANPEYKPRNLEEKIVQKLAGVIWVDEKAHDVARLEAYFTGDAKIAGGLLASVQKGTGFVFEQEYVNNEVWLPTYEEAHIGARVLLLKGLRVGDITRYSDYKKYHVAASSTLSAPKQ